MPNEHIEIGKSYFALAQIFGVVAGLMLLSSGFYSISAQDEINLKSDAYDYCYKLNKNLSNQSTKNCADFSEGEIIKENILSSNKLSRFFSLIGILFALITIGIWSIGFGKMKRKNFPDERALTIVLGFISIAIILIMILINKSP